ncbi:MAG: tripartite tricarboxylate transporter TctB family protein [Woeseiaceae bacterium]|nr:tripartite tricarboxylate transporter TctB family protein [Woeseiaceae bacterium]
MTMTGFFQNRDRVFALVLIVLASIFYALIGDMEEPYSPGALAASTYPRLILACIIGLSCMLIIQPVSSEQQTTIIPWKGLAVILLAAGYIFLIERVGFFVLTPVFLLLVPLVVGYRHYVATAASAILVTAGLYAVFVLVLNIPLPAGLLGD